MRNWIEDENSKVVEKERESKEKVKCRVINVKTYPSFVELYQDNDKVLLGYEKDDIASPDDMLKYYSKERQAKYLAMAIYIEII